MQATPLNSMAVPTADVAFNGKKITGLANPTLAQDAATRFYVDTASAGSIQKYATNLTSGTVTEVITHNLGSLDVTVEVYEITGGATILTNVERPVGGNTVTLRFSVAPVANTLRCVVVG